MQTFAVDFATLVNPSTRADTLAVIRQNKAKGRRVVVVSDNAGAATQFLDNYSVDFDAIEARCPAGYASYLSAPVAFSIRDQAEDEDPRDAARRPVFTLPGDDDDADERDESE